jgi:predicted Zn-ribbon and HTH transcriptional regulator
MEVRKMSAIQMPIVCPKCKSTELCEIADKVYQKLTYRYVGSEFVLYELKDEDNENFGNTYLKCGGCGFEYDQEIYEAWLENI